MKTRPSIHAIVADFDDTLAYSSPKLTEAHVDVEACRSALLCDFTTMHTRIVREHLALVGENMADCDCRTLIDALNAVKFMRNGFLESSDVMVRVASETITQFDLSLVGQSSRRLSVPVRENAELSALIEDLIRNSAIQVIGSHLVLPSNPSASQRMSLEKLATLLQTRMCAGISSESLALHGVFDSDIEEDLVYRMKTWDTNVAVVTGRTKEMLNFGVRTLRKRVALANRQLKLIFVYENGRWCENGFGQDEQGYSSHTLYERSDGNAIQEIFNLIGGLVKPYFQPDVDRLDLKRYELDLVLKSAHAEANQREMLRIVENALRGLDLRAESYPGHVQIKPSGLNKGLAIDFLAREFGLSPDSMLVLGDALPDLAMLQKPGVTGVLVNAEQNGLKSTQVPEARTVFTGRTNSELCKQVIRSHRFAATSSLADKSGDLFITEHVDLALRALAVGEMNEVVKYLWRAAMADPENELLELLALLQQKGVSESLIDRIVCFLVGLRVDPSNPWTSTYTLSDLIGHLSADLFGEDLGGLKDVVRSRRRDSTAVAPKHDFVMPPSIDSQVIRFKRDYQQMRKRQLSVILSDRPACAIAAQISTETNDFLEQTLRVLVPQILQKENCRVDSDAGLYFADMKSFASDFDFIYWGPKCENVTRRIIDVLTWLGVKSDPFAVLFLNDSIAKHSIDEYVYHSFNFRGRVILNGRASFREFHNKTIQEHADLESMWRKVRPYMDSQFALWLGHPQPDKLQLAPGNIKKLYYRALFNLLFGLSVKFNVPFTTDETQFKRRLEEHLYPGEIGKIFAGLDLVSQMRNVFQLITRRRWEGEMDASTAKRIFMQLRKQGIEDIDLAIRQLGLEMEQIRSRHFGRPIYWTQGAIDIHSGDEARSRWSRVAEMCRLSHDEAFTKVPDQQQKSEEKIVPLQRGLRAAPFPLEIDWFPVLKCSLDCEHCWSMGTVFDPSVIRSLSPSQIIRMIDILYNRGVRAVTITGGEPMLWNELENNIRTLHDRGMLVRLYTHGLHCVDRQTGKISGPTARRLETILSYTDTLSLSVDPYHDYSYREKFRSLRSKPYREIVADIIRYVALRKPGIDLQIISVLGQVKGGNGTWWSADEIVEYYLALGQMFAESTVDLPHLRWKLNRYRFNQSMQEQQVRLKIDEAMFERLVEQIRNRCLPLFSKGMQITISHRLDYGYVFIRSDGLIMTMKAAKDNEMYIKLGSFLTGSIRHTEIWDQLRSSVIDQARAVGHLDFTEVLP